MAFLSRNDGMAGSFRFLLPPTLLALLLALLLLPASPAAAADATIRLDPATTFQRMTGWEATPDVLAPQDFRPDTFRRAVEEVGINRIRLEIRSGAENRDRNSTRFIRGELPHEDWRPLRYATVNDNADPLVIDWDGFDFGELDSHVERVVLPLRDLLAARGEKLSVNLCYVAFTSQIRGGKYLHDNPDEYAEFILAAFLHLDRKYGFVPDHLEVILEPDLVAQWKNGKVIGRAIVATAARLKEAGWTPGFIAPSVTDMRNAVPFLDGIASVPGAVAHLREFSYHRYKGASPETLRAIAARASQLGLGTSMLEWWFGNATYEVLHEDLRTGGISAFQGRALQEAFDGKRQRPGDGLAPLNEDVRINSLYYRSIRMGAVRIGALSDALPAFDPLAFVNTDGGTVVIVKAARAGTVAVEGLPPGRYRIAWGLKEGSGELETPVEVGKAGRIEARIPGRGVLVLSPAKP